MPETTASPSALVFPGQGSQNFKMLARAKAMPDFNKFYPVICEKLKTDLFKDIEQSDANYINKNAVSSILTVFLSVLHFEDLKRSHPVPHLFAGYSVGQFSALYASGALSFESLIEIVQGRAAFMDQMTEKTKAGMLAVIGLMDDVVESVCQDLRAQNLKVWISNFNAPAQYSLAGTIEGIEKALVELQKKSPKKIMMLPVAGGWHCPLLEAAAEPFCQFLRGYKISLGPNRVVDNVTGDFLPVEQKNLFNQLGAHLHKPVQWEKCIIRLGNSGATQAQETGFGNMLTKYGFFIGRVVNHEAGLN